MPCPEWAPAQEWAPGRGWVPAYVRPLSCTAFSNTSKLGMQGVQAIPASLCGLQRMAGEAEATPPHLSGKWVAVVCRGRFWLQRLPSSLHVCRGEDPGGGAGAHERGGWLCRGRWRLGLLHSSAGAGSLHMRESLLSCQPSDLSAMHCCLAGGGQLQMGNFPTCVLAISHIVRRLLTVQLLRLKVHSSMQPCEQLDSTPQMALCTQGRCSLQVQQMCMHAPHHLRSVLGASRQHQAAAVLVVRVPLARPALALRWGVGKALLGWRRRHARLHAPVASWLLRGGAGAQLGGVAGDAARLLGWRGCHSLGAAGLLWAPGLLGWRGCHSLGAAGLLWARGLLRRRAGHALRRGRSHSWLDALIRLGLLSRRAGHALRRG